MKFNLSLEKDFQFKVGIHTIKVKFVSNNEISKNESGKEKEDEEIIYGKWLAKEQIILINKEFSYEMKLSTFWHEALHVLEDYYSINLSHADINRIGEIVSMILIDNFQDAEIIKRKGKSKNDSRK